VVRARLLASTTGQSTSSGRPNIARRRSPTTSSCRSSCRGPARERSDEEPASPRPDDLRRRHRARPWNV